MLTTFSAGKPENERPLRVARRIILNRIINEQAIRASIC
jgi:hypothetical protein